MVECLDSTFSALTITAKMGGVAMLLQCSEEQLCRRRSQVPWGTGIEHQVCSRLGSSSSSPLSTLSSVLSGQESHCPERRLVQGQVLLVEVETGSPGS